MRKFSLTIATAAAAMTIAALAGCSAGTPSDDSASEAPPVETTAPETAAADLTVADSSIGEIIVNGEGFTAYMFDKDTQGTTTSACVDACADAWPGISPAAADAVVEGIDGEIGTITGANGEPQLTVNGWPVYTFAQDVAAGDVNGQGFNGVWHALDAAGDPIL